MSAVGNDIGLDAPVAGRTDRGIVCHFAVVTAIIGLSHTVGIDDMVAVCRGSNAYHRWGTARMPTLYAGSPPLIEGFISLG